MGTRGLFVIKSRLAGWLAISLTNDRSRPRWSRHSTGRSEGFVYHSEHASIRQLQEAASRFLWRPVPSLFLDGATPRTPPDGS